MKHFKIIFFLISLSLFFGCSEDKIDGSTDVYGSISGKVVSSDAFTPLENVKVFSSPTSSIVFTDAEGKFTINNVKVGEYALQAQKDAYLTKFESVTVNKELNSEVVFELSKNNGVNVAPTAPIAVAPLDNATGQSLTTKLQWNTTDVNDDALTYELSVRNDKNNFVAVFSDVKVKELELTNLLFGTKYFWQVSATDGKSTAILSPVYTFSTVLFPNTRYLMVKKMNANNVIFAADSDKNTYQITSSENNSWRPRKNIQSGKIAYIQSNGAQNHIYTMNADGSDKIKVTNSIPIAGFNPDFVGFSWNASGDKIIYPNFDKLYEINSSGSGLRKIFQTPNGKFISECDWSNDGSKIAIKVNDSQGYNCEIYIISPSGAVLSYVLSGQNGAVGALNLSVTGTKLLYTADVSGYENPNYRQLDMQIFEFNLLTGFSTQVSTDKVAGTNDLDVRYAPNEAEVIFVNTSNDGASEKYITKMEVVPTSITSLRREVLFTGFFMPDWE
tara:strand:- start:12015 stop:13517 length:1503 start_codon:yes stop_codon:yes gene_type:complete